MHKPGDNLTILNVDYERPHRGDDGKLKKDYITLVYKDLNKGIKEHKTIYNPKFTYYFLKKEYTKPYSQFFVPKDQCIPVTTKYRELLRDIASRTGHLDDFYENCRNGNSGANRLLHTDPRVLSSDITIESFYRMEFDKTYKNDTCLIDKCFLDIEVDTRPINGAFPSPGECPVNAVSMLMEKTNTEYVFILKDPENPNSIEFEKYVSSHDFVKEYKEFLNENLGGWKNVVRMGLDKIKYKFIFFDREADLVASIFRIINTIQPDFVLAWNMAFDIPYLIERIKVLGMDPIDIICHPDFEEKKVEYFVDKIHAVAAERGDYAKISSYTVYIDQMIQFASRRKGQSAFANNKLDYIGEVIAGCRKLDYHDITENLSDLPYDNFKVFIMYNMTDVVVQWCIEKKTGDIDYVFNKSIINSTQYGKVHRQTVYLANRAAMEFWKAGYVIGNNINKYNDLSEEEKKKRKYPGAYVAPPMLLGNTPKVKLHYEGLPEQAINVARNANDFDYKALYPSLMRENNIAPNTQIGMLQIPEKIYEGENPFNLPVGIYKDQFNRAETFIENFASRNYIEFCKRWFNLAGVEEMIEDFDEYFHSIEHPLRPLNLHLAQTRKFEKVDMTPFKNERLKVVTRLKNKDGLIPVVGRYKQMPAELRTKIKEIQKMMEIR